MTPVSKHEMELACEQWLKARERFMTSFGAEPPQPYRLASERLFAAFVRDWPGDDFPALSRAFQEFRQALVETHDSRPGYPAWWPEKSLPIRC
jgi:hypothetical protein